MAYKSKLFFLVAFLACAMCHYTVVARPISPSLSSLAARLKLEEDQSSDCWGSLIQLQACTGEIILFFLNGETYIGQGCCQAIRTISQSCWPDMIDTLGYTAEEGHILEGYCDGGTHPLPPSAAVSDDEEGVAKQSLVP